MSEKTFTLDQARALLSLSFALCLGTIATAQEMIVGTVAGNNVQFRRAFIQIGESQVALDVYQPLQPGRYPAVLLIHGTGGLYTHDGSKFPVRDNFGEQYLAANGYVALLVHYMSATATIKVTSQEEIHQHAGEWLEALGKAIDYAVKLPEVDADRIALLGESLGGYLAIALAAADARVRAVSELYGGMPDLRPGQVAKLPPILIQHGEKDTVVPVAEAHKLERILRQHSIPHEVHIYPGLPHALDTERRATALRRTIGFFERHLRSKHD